MIFNKLRKAFSLTELLIVVVVIAVLFSAMLPIMTKRRGGSTTGNEPVWQFVPSEQHDAFYDRNVPSLTSAAYFGLDPDNISNSESGKYPSKVQIKANPNQHHIQFRYGTAFGTLTGLFAMDKTNTLGTSKLTGKEKSHNSNSILAVSTNVNNTALGNGVFARAKEAIGITSVGLNSTMGRSGTDSVSSNTIAIGAGANQYGKAGSSVVLGSGAAKTEDGSVSSTVALGAGSLGLPTSSARSSVMAGADTATVSTFGTGNVVLGSNYMGNSTDSNYNTILGHDAYTNANSKNSYMTAVGENACNSLVGCDSSGNCPSKKTCIGASSGGNYGSVSTKYMGWETDDMEHVFLGGYPQSVYAGGRSVLEVHNMYGFSNANHGSIDKPGYTKIFHPGNSLPNIAPTVVMNSNLVVRGNVFWSSSDGVLRPHDLTFLLDTGTETGSDRCDRKCYSRFGRKKWRAGECKSFFSEFLEMLGPVGALVTTFIVGVGMVLLDIVSLGSAIALSVAYVALTVATLTQGEQGERGKDPFTASMVQVYTANDAKNACAYTNENYPRKDKGCPDLNLGLSDIRLKDNLSENKDAIEKLLFVMPYDYTFKADKASKPQVGVIAQDLQKYFPNSVVEDKNGNLNIRWDEMFFASINSMKNLDKVVQNLENDVTSLEADNDKLLKEHKSMNKRIKNMNNRLKNLEK